MIHTENLEFVLRDLEFVQSTIIAREPSDPKSSIHVVIDRRSGQRIVGIGETIPQAAVAAWEDAFIRPESDLPLSIRQNARIDVRQGEHLKRFHSPHKAWAYAKSLAKNKQDVTMLFNDDGEDCIARLDFNHQRLRNL